MSIQFGSPEAKAIREKDKALEEQENDGIHYVVYPATTGYDDDISLENETEAVNKAASLSNGFRVYVVAQVSDDETDDTFEYVAITYDGEVFYA